MSVVGYIEAGSRRWKLTDSQLLWAARAKLPNVRPASAMDDAADCAEPNIVFLGEGVHGSAGADRLPNLANVSFRKLCGSDLCSTKATSFGFSIPRVVEVRSAKQVVWTDAGRRVAGMQYVQRASRDSVGEFENDAAYQGDRASRKGLRVDDSVPVFVASSCPQPATVVFGFLGILRQSPLQRIEGTGHDVVVGVDAGKVAASVLQTLCSRFASNRPCCTNCEDARTSGTRQPCSTVGLDAALPNQARALCNDSLVQLFGCVGPGRITH